jgi:hypothetical protein
MQVRWRFEQIDPPTKFSSKYWRDRAAATMVQADRDWIDEKRKFRLLRIAREYDKLADAAALQEPPTQLAASFNSNLQNRFPRTTSPRRRHSQRP